MCGTAGCHCSRAAGPLKALQKTLSGPAWIEHTHMTVTISCTHTHKKMAGTQTCVKKHTQTKRYEGVLVYSADTPQAGMVRVLEPDKVE